jgi:hypothetical protein
MIQRPDFWDTVAQNVKVIRSDISDLGKNSINLMNGLSHASDVIICATGFRHEYLFFNEEQRAKLGLPQSREVTYPEHTWAELESEADKRILERFPKLERPPATTHTQHSAPGRTPSRLYNCIASLHDPSIAFVGNVYVPNSFLVAEVQAI